MYSYDSQLIVFGDLGGRFALRECILLWDERCRILRCWLGMKQKQLHNCETILLLDSVNIVICSKIGKILRVKAYVDKLIMQNMCLDKLDLYEWYSRFPYLFFGVDKNLNGTCHKIKSLICLSIVTNQRGMNCLPFFEWSIERQMEERHRLNDFFTYMILYLIASSPFQSSQLILFFKKIKNKKFPTNWVGFISLSC